MEDLNKNAETEKPIKEKTESNKETAKETVINEPQKALKRIRVRAKTKPTPANLAKTAPEESVKISAPEVEPSKDTQPVRKKNSKTEEKIAVVKSPKKEKAEVETVVQNETIADDKPKPTDKQERTDSDDKKLKVIRKKAKKAEEKVVKLKKEVKKAKKKEVKKSKLKGLKEKLEKALKKFKVKVKELKKAK